MQSEPHMICDENGDPRFALLTIKDYQILLSSVQLGDKHQSEPACDEGVQSEPATKSFNAGGLNDALAQAKAYRAVQEAQCILDQLPKDVCAVVEELARRLEEDKPQGLFLLGRVVQTLGFEEARQYLDETLRVQAKGGMKTEDGSRNRTAGGIFLKLVTNSVSAEDRKAIFEVSAPIPCIQDDERAADLLLRIAARAIEASCLLVAPDVTKKQAHRATAKAAQAIQQILAEVRSLVGRYRGKPRKKVSASVGSRKKAKCPFVSAAEIPKRKKKSRKQKRIEAQRTRTKSETLTENYSRLTFSEAAIPLGAGRVLAPVGGKKPGSHSSGRHS